MFSQARVVGEPDVPDKRGLVRLTLVNVPFLSSSVSPLVVWLRPVVKLHGVPVEHVEPDPDGEL